MLEAEKRKKEDFIVKREFKKFFEKLIVPHLEQGFLEMKQMILPITNEYYQYPISYKKRIKFHCYFHVMHRVDPNKAKDFTLSITQKLDEEQKITQADDGASGYTVEQF